MARLRLHLDKYLGGLPTTDGAVTHLYGLDAQGRRDPTRDHRDLVIPAGRTEARLTVEVEPGGYLIEAILPSGDIATDQVEVAEGATVSVQLVAPHSPHEWLSWQQYLGNVPAEPDAPRKGSGRRTASARSARPASTQLERVDQYVGRAPEIELDHARSSWDRLWRDERRLGDRAGSQYVRPSRGFEDFFKAGRGGGLGGYSDTRPPDRISVGPVIKGQRATRTMPRAAPLPAWPVLWYVGSPVESLSGLTPDGANSWNLVIEESLGGNPLAGLGFKAKQVQHRMRDNERQIFSIGAGGQANDDKRDRSRAGVTPRRYVVAVQPEGPVELACLPVPWQNGLQGRVPIEVLVRRQPLHGETMIAMSPRDPSIGSALGYMGTGALANARVIFDRARALLFEKQINPLGAAAGGYVLLATDQGQQDQAWHQWIENLANWFGWLPDGMILLGRLRMRSRRNEADLRVARQAFFDAYDRGIPYYSLGLQWLVDGLGLLATNDNEARKRLAAVQRVAWLANLQQPFTTLRLRDR